MSNMTNSFVYMEYQEIETISNLFNNIFTFGNIPQALVHHFMWSTVPVVVRFL